MSKPRRKSPKKPLRKKSEPVKGRRKLNYLLFYLKDFGFAVLLVISFSFFINGSFYTDKSVDKFKKDYRKYMISKASEADKQKQRNEKDNNIEKLKMSWGYYFVYNRLFKSNLKRIQDNPELTQQQKIYSKSGELGYLFHSIKENTPDSAVVIIPLTENELENKDYSFKFNNKMNKYPKLHSTKKYINWFIYPRKLLYLTEQDKPKLATATHIMIFDSKGAEYAEYEKGKQLSNYKIYPVKKN